MARRGRSERHTRDATDIASPSLRLSEILHSLPTPSTYLQMLEDRRLYFPEPTRPARAFHRSATQLQVPNVQKQKLYPPPAVGFVAPNSVAICVRRHQRREVLFARGFRGRKRQRARWSEYSSIRCK